MSSSFLYQTPVIVITVVLFMCTLIMYRFGFLLRKEQTKKKEIDTTETMGPVEGSLLGLLALLLSFTFSMSASRYDERRQIIVEEANAIKTVILRTDLFTDSIKKALQNDLKEYVEARIDYYNAVYDETKINNALRATENISSKIWKTSVFALKNNENEEGAKQLIPALNDMISAVTTREEIKNATVPDSVLWLLFTLILCSSFIIGYNNTGKTIKHILIISFAVMVSLTVYLILDLDRPRKGNINIGFTQQNIVALRELFKN